MTLPLAFPGTLDRELLKPLKSSKVINVFLYANEMTGGRGLRDR